MSRAFQRSPICCHCTGMRKIMHIGALCSHGTKNNQHNSSTQPRTQPCTMSDGDICSDDEKYGGFGAVMATLLRRQDRTTPARAVAAVAAARAPGTKKSPQSMSMSAPGSPSAHTSARISLPCLCLLRRLQHPLQCPHPFLL